jgi:hypothetical protein
MSLASVRPPPRPEKRLGIEVLERDQPRRAEDHDEDEEQRDDDPLEDLQGAQRLAEQADTDGADDRPV